MKKKSTSVPKTGVSLLRTDERKSGRRKKNDPLPKADEDAQRLIQEMEAYQNELEIQNKELARSRAVAEEAYRQYTNLYDFAPVGYFTLTREGTIHEVNLAGANLLGMERDNLINRRLGLYVAIESRPAFGAFLEKLLTGMGKETSEFKFLKNGDEPIQVNVEATCFEGGQESRVVLMDITARRQAEAALRESEEHYHLVRENTLDAILLTRPDGTILSANEAACEMLQRTEEELRRIGRNGLVDKTDPRLQALLEERARSGKARGEFTMVRKNGEKFPVEVSTSVFIDKNGENKSGMIIRDITDRKKAEEKLLLQSAALNAAANTIIITDRDGMIVWVNPAFTLLTGYNAAEAIGRNPRELVKSDKQDTAFYKHLWDTILAGQVWRGELINRRKDGSTYIEEQTITPLLNPLGNVTHFIAVKQDVTERKKVVEKLRHLGIHDALTGIYNRGFFMEEMARLERGREFPVSIVMADVDRLKQTNDKAGHAAGDDLLKRAAQILTEAFRAEDVVARVGGDEFAVLLPRADAAAAEVSLQRVRQVIHENNASHTGVPIHISLGVSTAEKSALLSAALKEADARMYRDKRGRDAS